MKIATVFISALLISCVLLAESAQASQCPFANQDISQVETHQFESAVGCLINRERADLGHKHVTANTALEKAAVRHSKTMARQQCLAHQCGAEPSLSERVTDSGYPKNTAWDVSENLARISGGLSAKDVFKLWMASPAYRKAMLKDSYRHFGISVQGSYYITALFAFR